MNLKPSAALTFGMRVGLLALMVVGYLTSAGVAKADAIYTLNNPGQYSWSFDVPAIITTDTTITSFVSTNVVPTGILGSLGCTSIDSVLILSPSIANAQVVPQIRTSFPPGTGLCLFGTTDPTFFGSPITSFGTFPASLPAGATLTISPSAAVPEPSSLLLLVAGLSALGVVRRKLART